MSTHRCAAIGCNQYIARKQLMCRGHWYMVPIELQLQIRQAHQHRARELGRYLELKAAAVRHVAEREGKIAPALQIERAPA